MSVVVVGSANVDTVIRGDRLPRPGETVEAGGYAEGPGGKGLNQAVAAHRAGADVTFFYATGDDSGAKFLNAFLSADNMDTRPLTTDQPTGRAFIQIDSHGENSIMIVGGANTALSAWPDTTIVDAIEQADFLVLQQEVSTELNLSLARLAHTHHTQVVLTPAPVEKTAENVLELVDILVLNEHEAQQVASTATALDGARALSDTRTVVVTQGKDGATVFRDGTLIGQGVAPAVTAVDTTGAGDCFVGFFVASLDRGSDITDAVSYACVAAALSVTTDGAAPAIPLAHDVDTFRKEHP
jgi:ribokinase